MKLDNSTVQHKVSLRVKLLYSIDNPVVLETYGGTGEIFKQCYAHLSEGIVFEEDFLKAAWLCWQRPSWSVYQFDCISAVRAGAGSHLEINLLDVDPYGSPWPVLEAFFVSERPRASRLWIVVSDGLRQKLSRGGGWSVKRLQPVVERWGNRLHGRYLEVCEELMVECVGQAGYRLASFDGYYCGIQKQRTHYVAEVSR